MTFLAAAEDVLTAVGMKAVNASEFFRNPSLSKYFLISDWEVF